MTTLDDALSQIAARRKRDPLAPVTVITPSHVAALQLRRRLAAIGPFAAVRFETLPRLAELLGAGALAKAGRRPLARPIGDYLAAEVAKEATGGLAGVRELPGFGRVLRQTFRRLRRGGFRGGDVPVELDSGHLGEVARLYGLYRARSARFYDDEDLLDAAAEALTANGGGFPAELGEVWLAPPGALSAGAERLLTALKRRAAAFRIIDEEEAAGSETRIVLAPDPASEAREAVREVVRALDGGCRLSDVAIFYGADSAYRLLLSQALAAADVPAFVLPGRPLVETPAGRGVLALAGLPATDYSRSDVFDFLNLAPLRAVLPAGDATAPPLTTAWQRLARDAGVTHGLDRWRDGIAALMDDYDATLASQEEVSEGRRRATESDRERAAQLSEVIEALVRRLEPLRASQPAASFVERFKAVVNEYLRPDAEALTEVLAEVDQLGTVDAVGGSFSLASFVEALRANLTLAARREQRLGEGVLVADYRVAAGLRFRHVVLCGAHEGVFPGVSTAETLVSDATWAHLRERHPFVEDAALRLQRAQAAARRAVSTASEGITWAAALRDATGNADRYPSSLMLAAARRLAPEIATATALRTAPAHDWLIRAPSPLAARLQGKTAVDEAELQLRRTILERRDGIALHPAHPLRQSVALLRARRGAAFSVFDGNLHDLPEREQLLARATASPTALESYATCGMRYLFGNVLRLRPVDDPEERETMDPAERGSLVHAVLEGFFREQQALGRPRVGEAWTEDDVEALLARVDARLQLARRRGLTGLDIYAGFDRRTLRADLAAFLAQDSEFRLATGAVPALFEQRIPLTPVGELQMSGFVDRVDLTPDGRSAWVIDYKTGSASSFEKTDTATDPFAGGTKLQLPVYVFAAAGAEKVTALYWFISRRGEFKKIEFMTTPQTQARFEATLGAIGRGLRTGAFPAVPGPEDEFYGGFDNCKYCDFTRICSLRRNYEHVDKLTDPALDVWLRVGRVARGEEQP